MNPSTLSRRTLLAKAGMGIGALAMLDLMSREMDAADNPLAPKITPRPARARAVISLFMHGGPSQVDTFDPKPMLAKYAGQKLPPRPVTPRFWQVSGNSKNAVSQGLKSQTFFSTCQASQTKSQ